MTTTEYPDTPSLFDSVDAVKVTNRRPTILERFESFHAANPWVLGELVKRVAAIKAQGSGYVSIKYLVEELRAEHARDVKQTGPFVIDNSIVAVYSERIRAEHPELCDVIRSRKRTAA